MAAYMRGVIYFLSSEKTSLLLRRGRFMLEPKRYIRGLRRKPVKVLFPEYEASKIPKQSVPELAKPNVKKEKKAKAIVTPAAKHPEQNVFKARASAQEATKPVDMTFIKDEMDGIRFERAYPGDKRLARLASVARSRTFREHQGKILLEGRRLICDALDAGANPQMVFFSTVERLRELPVAKLKRATLVKVKFEDIKTWSDLVTPQGVIAIFSRPDPTRLNFTNRGHSVPLSLICDNIRDPGNLGTMLRCAAAAGCHNVLLTKGCVDVWEPKVLRAAMGAHFHLPIYPSLDWADIGHYLPKSVTVHVADSSCGTRRNDDAHSLINVSDKPSKAGDYGWVSARPSKTHHHYEDYDSDSDCEDEGPSLPRVDAKLYYETWAQSPAALVVGGETHGLSLEALELADKTDGQRLFIPVVPDVDSLNSAMAASILLFEGRKQLLKAMQSMNKLKSKAGTHSS